MSKILCSLRSAIYNQLYLSERWANWKYKQLGLKRDHTKFGWAESIYLSVLLWWLNKKKVGHVCYDANRWREKVEDAKLETRLGSTVRPCLVKKQNNKPRGGGTHLQVQLLGGRERRVSELEASLVCRVSSMTAKGTQRTLSWKLLEKVRPSILKNFSNLIHNIVLIYDHGPHVIKV